MSSTAQQLIGRDDELGAIERLLDARDDLPGTVVLHGQAGVGKTALWLAGIDAASARGYLILSSRPSEAETQFSFGGLTDLLGGVAGAVLPELPPIQQRALEAALLLGESEVDVDDRAVAAAFLAALRVLARDGPLCLAVDDVQWLDAASRTTLGYALGRLDSEPVAALLAARGEVPEWLRRATAEERVRMVEVEGLSVGATQELLRARLDATFPRPTLVRLWETSGGNPFFALELARGLQRRGGRLIPGDPLPIPSTLEELLRERLDGLAPAALEVARVVAALAEPTTDLVDAALGARSDDGLTETLDAQILELDGTRLRFTHPLLGSAVTARQSPSRRRALNARLSDVVSSPEERARHLALATADVDNDVAAILEEAARTAQARGAPVEAAELAEQALRLTPPSSPDGNRRLLEAADLQFRAGDPGRATDLLEHARAAAPPGNERAAVLAQLAYIQPSPIAAIALYREALTEAEGDDTLQATIHLNLAGMMRFGDGIESGLEHGRLAVLAASRVDDVALRCRALAAHGLLHFNSGRGIPATMEEALSLERSLPGWPLADGASTVFGHQLWWSGDVERARTLFQEILHACAARNDPLEEASARWYLSLLEWRAGNWDEADRYAAESMSLTAQLGHQSLTDEFPPAIIAAHKGRIDEARARAQSVVERGDAELVGMAPAGYSWVLGFVDLSLGDAASALAHLRRAAAKRDEMGVREPGMQVELGDLLEALIGVGELDEAEEILAIGQERADALDRPWALAILARCRGLLLAARGDFDGAFVAFDRALAEHARSIDPFHHARTQLALGRTQRRAKKRAAARATLEDALARYETLGAPLWAAQTRGEMARIGGRAPSRGELTEAERRIAALVVEGHTNREVATALFLTVHSVETALTRIYRKLGIHSRTELGRVLSNS